MNRRAIREPRNATVRPLPGKEALHSGPRRACPLGKILFNLAVQPVHEAVGRRALHRDHAVLQATARLNHIFEQNTRVLDITYLGAIESIAGADGASSLGHLSKRLQFIKRESARAVHATAYFQLVGSNIDIFDLPVDAAKQVLERRCALV